MKAGNSADTTDRVRKNSPSEANKKIDAQVVDHVRQYKTRDHVQLSERIAEVEKEWSIERYIETFAPSLILGGTALAAYRDKRWAILPVVVAAFLLQHGLQGWCPPVPMFRAFGVRTRKEIDWEKFSLKVLRGDFNTVDINDEVALVDAVKRVV